MKCRKEFDLLKVPEVQDQHSLYSTFSELIKTTFETLEQKKKGKPINFDKYNDFDNLSKETLSEILGVTIPDKFFTYTLTKTVLTEEFEKKIGII